MSKANSSFFGDLFTGWFFQAVIAGVLSFAIYWAFPTQVPPGFSLGRFLYVIFKTRDFFTLFQICWVTAGILSILFLLPVKDKKDTQTPILVAVIAFLVPCLLFPKLSAFQRFIFCLVAGVPLPVALRLKNPKSSFSMEHVRGTEIVSGQSAQKLFSQLLNKELAQGDKAGISFWQSKVGSDLVEARLPFSKESQHLLVAGSTGSGKTQIIYPILKQVHARGDQLVIWDVKGTYTQSLMGQPGVQLLAPWDSRSMSWRVGADIVRPLDCHEAASVLIPENPRDPQPFFSNAARQILEAVLIQLDAASDQWGWGDVWKSLAQGKDALVQELQRSQEGRAAAMVISGDSKGAQDVFSTLISACHTVRWLAKAWPQEGASLRQWLHSGSGSLILGGTPEREKLAGAVANLAIQILVSEINSMPDDPNRRIWFFLDELASLGRIDALSKLATMGRSKGGCIVAGIQDIGQIEHLYGRELTKSLANTFRTTIFLRCADAATSQWAADVIGKQEVIEKRKGYSEGSSDSGASTSESEHETAREKHAFMPSQIANFPDMQGIFRLAGWPVARLNWLHQKIPNSAPLVVEAPWTREKAKLDDLVSGPTVLKVDPPTTPPVPPPQWKL